MLPLGSGPVPVPGGPGCAPGRSLINVVLTLIVSGVLLYLINRFIPMQRTIKTILNWVIVICVIIWLLYGFGVISSGASVPMPMVK